MSRCDSIESRVDDAQDDLDLCVGTLGLRLVKTTVNFDNHHVYHFYYGDKHGTPGVKVLQLADGVSLDEVRAKTKAKLTA
mgnify:CR=1 FL=1